MDAGKIEAAVSLLNEAVQREQLRAAAITVIHRGESFSQSFGAAPSPEAIFLLASISKPISVVGLMTLFEKQHFSLDDPVQKFLSEFKGGSRGNVTMRHLLSHTSGLPDQLPENVLLRQRHASLSEFVAASVTTPLLFEPGTEYRYSSMATLLASEVAQRITGIPFPEFLRQTVFDPLGMRHSALGLGPGLDRVSIQQTMQCQTDRAAAESGGGSQQSTSWDWNSDYWRRLGAPWGGAHGSAPDVSRFFAEMLHPSGVVLNRKTVDLMLQNHNPSGLTPHGLGFGLGIMVGGRGCSERTFGHTGSTGTLAWADPATDTVCVVLTTLPAGAVRPHPRRQVSDLIAEAVVS